MRLLSRHRRAFTLVEIMLYVGLTSILMVAMLRSVVTVLEHDEVTSSRETVQQQLRVVMEQILHDIREADSINNGYSTFNANQGELGLTFSESNRNPTVYKLIDGAVKVRKGTSGWKAISGTSMVVEQLHFTKKTSPNTAASVGISIRGEDPFATSGYLVKKEVTVRGLATIRDQFSARDPRVIFGPNFFSSSPVDPLFGFSASSASVAASSTTSGPSSPASSTASSGGGPASSAASSGGGPASSSLTSPSSTGSPASSSPAICWMDHQLGSPDFSFSHKVIDVDSDGDMDIVRTKSSGLFTAVSVNWYDNNGADPPSFVNKFVNGLGVISTAYVDAGDMDKDTDVDLVAGLSTIDWYDNNGTELFTKKSVGAVGGGASRIIMIDMNNDTEVDVFVPDALSGSPEIVWFDNDGTETFTKRTVDTSVTGLGDAYPAKLDADAYNDVVAIVGSTVTWYKSDGADPPAFTQQTDIDSSFVNPSVVYAADLDGDTDIDVIAGSFDGNLQWYRNNGAGSFTAQPAISTSVTIINSIAVGDINGDSNVDIALTSSKDLVWYESDGASPPTFTEYTIDSTTNNEFKWVTIDDVNGDTANDVVRSAIDLGGDAENNVAWYDYVGACGSSTSVNSPSSTSNSAASNSESLVSSNSAAISSANYCLSGFECTNDADCSAYPGGLGEGCSGGGGTICCGLQANTCVGEQVGCTPEGYGCRTGTCMNASWQPLSESCTCSGGGCCEFPNTLTLTAYDSQGCVNLDNESMTMTFTVDLDPGSQYPDGWYGTKNIFGVDVEIELYNKCGEDWDIVLTCDTNEQGTYWGETIQCAAVDKMQGFLDAGAVCSCDPGGSFRVVARTP